jgi:hypothetical protein
VLTSIIGSAYWGPELKRISGLIGSKGSNDPEVVRRLSRLIVISRIDLVVFLIVIFALVTKPGL